ncbi:hypothetical protein HDU87_004593 [Geranomyces variabilis]|uniref:Uncharacterized protein n=1 Tax=Geranomyces variabilis TaxID=109894 RepID=A0AAD5TJM6_9FUNG|nr:hypothetical protein HDU87_004593 [Geranomyces variabilis]
MEWCAVYGDSLSSLCHASGKRARSPSVDSSEPEAKRRRAQVASSEPLPPPLSCPSYISNEKAPATLPPLQVDELSADTHFYLGNVRLHFDVSGANVPMDLGPTSMPVHVGFHFEKSRTSAEMLVQKDGLVILSQVLHLEGARSKHFSPSSVLEALAMCARRNLCILSGALDVDGTAWPQPALHLCIRIYLASPSASLIPDDFCRELYHLLLHLYPPRESSEDADDFLSQLLPTSYPGPGDSPHLQSPELNPTLLAYQRRAVLWMLYREGMRLESDKVVPLHWKEYTENVLAPPLWFERIETDLGNSFYVNRLRGTLSLDRPAPKDNIRGVKGGILADEMGLGKTVILLALILLHPAPTLELPLLPQLRDPTSEPNLDAANTRPYPGDACQVCGRLEQTTSPEDWICCDQCESWYHFECVQLDTFVDGEKYICPSCEETEVAQAPAIIRSRGTIIITPASILDQWATEAEAHAPSLSVFAFTGTEKVPVTASHLASYDLVLTSYDVLRKEVHAARPGPGRSRRLQRKHQRRTSPLVGVSFFRVVLDEAQMVESSVSAAAAMAAMIPTYGSRWAVTGTPIGKHGLADLYGLISFLRIEPLASDAGIWRRIQLPVHRALLKDMLRQFMHRNTKANVAGELTLLPQSNKTLYLEFSKVERTWYDQLYEEMLEESRRAANDQLRSMWLLQLRQTCCHPQIGAHNKRVLGGVLRSIGDVLDVMLRQAKSAAFSAETRFFNARVHRAQMLEIIAKNNGWEEYGAAPLSVYGAIYTDIRRALEAVQQERNAVIAKQKLMEQPRVLDESQVGTDLLEDQTEQQGEHTGSQDTIEEINDEMTALTGRIRSLQELQHRVVYFTASVHHSMKNEQVENEKYEEATKIRAELLGPVEEEAQKLISHLLSYVRTREDRITSAPLLDPLVPPLRGGFSGSIFNNLKKRAVQLDSQWEVLLEWRQIINEALCSPLKSPTPDEEPPTATNAEQGAVETKEDEYQQALELQTRVDIYRNRYMALLLDRKQLLIGERAMDEKREVLTETAEEKQLRAELEKVRRRFILKGEAAPLRSLAAELRRARQRPLPEVERRLVEEAGDALHKVLEKQRAAWDSLETEARAGTKVLNARIAYFRDLQHLSDGVLPAIVPRDVQDEIDDTLKDEAEMQRLLASQVSRVRYLQHMMVEEAAGAQNILGGLPQIPAVPASAAPLPQTFAAPDDGKAFTKEFLGHLSHVPLTGSFGTKLDTLIRHIKYLEQTDPTSKSLVFSQWEQLLDYLGTGLNKNGVEYVKLNKGKKGKRGVLRRFREDDECRVFMLNARSQSAGLTLVSANHVFLIEPVVNVALEAQAINRVHRIGQTRETTVWRYIIANTIEERVAALTHRPGADANRSATAPNIALNSRASGDGERVDKKDVEWCLFGNILADEEEPEAAIHVIVEDSPAAPSPPPILDESATATIRALQQHLEEHGLPEEEESAWEPALHFIGQYTIEHYYNQIK